MQEIETYLARIKNNVTQFIKTRPIMDLCLVKVRSLGARFLKWWWEQEEIDLEGMRWEVREAEVDVDLDERQGELEEGDVETEK